MEQSSECQVQRIYIGNLPQDVEASHLFSILPDGYDKSKLEIMHNYDIDKNITSSYAFVNIRGSPTDIESWCLTASKKSLGGNVLQVQFAKLSFLERLKQEVDNSKRKKDFSNSSYDNFTKDYTFPKRNSNVICFESNNDYVDNCEIEPNSETHKTKDDPDLNLLSIKSSNNTSKAEIIRVESIKQRSSAHVSQQKIIKMSIKKMEKGPSNKKIFQNSDDELEDGPKETTHNNDPCGNTDKRNLFDGSESESDDEDIGFENVKRKSKLIRTNISAVDERFRMDSRFFDDNEPCKSNEAGDSENEQEDLLKIADSLIQQDPNARIKVKKKIDEGVIPTRFNPLEKKHSAFVIKKDEDILQAEVIKKPTKLKPFKVEKERYYQVSENLKEQFKCNESSGFSFLGLFGSDTVSQKPESSIDKTSEKKEEKQKKINVLRNPLEISASNFFNVDENSDIEEEETSKGKSSRKSKKSKLTWNEPLFIPLNDPRIEEALKFFSTPMQEVLPHPVISKALKNIVKKKYLKNIAKKKQFKTKLGGRKKFSSAKERKLKRKSKDQANS